MVEESFASLDQSISGEGIGFIFSSATCMGAAWIFIPCCQLSRSIHRSSGCIELALSHPFWMHGFFAQPTSSEAEATTPETSTSKETSTPEETQIEEKPLYYNPPTPAAIPPLKWTRSSLARYGVPSYTTPYSYQMSLSGLQVANYIDVHHLFEDTLDPYSDVFFFFSPAFGFPSPVSNDPTTGQPLLQISSPTEWGDVLPRLLASKCPIFVTGFSPADVERDVRSLATAPGVADEFEWIVTPGPNLELWLRRIGGSGGLEGKVEIYRREASLVVYLVIIK